MKPGMKFEMIFVLVFTVGFIRYCKSCSEEAQDGGSSKPEYEKGIDLCGKAPAKLKVEYSNEKIGSVSCGGDEKEREKELEYFNDESPSVVYEGADKVR